VKLEKKICLFANYSSKEEKIKFNRCINNYATTIKKDLPDLEVSTLLFEGKLEKHIGILAKKYNAILFCCYGPMNQSLLKAFYRSSIPFFFSKEQSIKTHRFKNILIPIDFRNSTKDATLWGSYMGRFNQSDIFLHTANDNKNTDSHRKVEKTIAFVNKFYNQFHFNFQFQQGKSSSWGIHSEANNIADQFDLLIFTGSLNVTLIDRILGPFEKRIINKTKTSILLINPQEELYLICN
jgi:hypothetical protein